ncbi:hypothetical protein niasHT_018006 [Heterodera trifolii]|uniref:Peptidase S1 domain-containing protein n=1 Tax=Heterodera trifolii TaxID=157864 RepID=A0ABD2LBU7_9BILA
MVKFWLTLFLVFTGNNLYSICAHKANFSQCGISDFEPDLDNVPSVKIGTNHIYKGRPVENANSMPWMVTLISLQDASSHSKVSGNDKFGTFSATNNSPFIVAGWGLTQPMCQKYPAPDACDQLMVGKMRMISMEECLEYTTKDINNEFNNLSNALPFVNNTRALLTEFNSAYLKDKFCVVAEPSLAEKGDSGGPLMRKIDKNNWVQVGVASTSMCSPEKPESTDGLTSEYTQIDCNWIEEATNGEVKSFRGTVNYLLALCSLFELLHQSGQFLFVYTAFSGQNFIEYRLAAKILFIPTIGLGGITPTMFFTGIDRLIGIAFSEIHDKLKTRLYLAMITVISLSYGFIFSVVSYQEANQDGLPSADSFNRRTFRALFCIITVNIGGYLISTITYFLIIPIASPVTLWFCALMAAIPMNIGAVSNGPILYFTSTEYRQAFQTEFPFVFKQTPNQNQVAPQQNGPPIRFYLAFKDVRPSWSLIGCALIYGLIATVGILLNSSVIFVTFLTNSFRGTVNYLLALCSLFELLHQSGQFLFVYTAFSGQNFIENRLPAKILFIPTIGLGGITPTMFFTGIDRLIGIAFSEIHDKLKTRLYLAMITVISLSYGFLFSVVSYQEAKQDGDLMVTGSYIDVLRVCRPLIRSIVALFVLFFAVVSRSDKNIILFRKREHAKTEQVVGRDGGRRKTSDERHRRLTAGARRAPANQSTACGSRADFFRSP